jgi:hypothetical protein
LNGTLILSIISLIIDHLLFLALRVYVLFTGAGSSPSKTPSIFKPELVKDWPSLRTSENVSGWEVKLTDVMDTVAHFSDPDCINGAHN